MPFDIARRPSCYVLVLNSSLPLLIESKWVSNCALIKSVSFIDDQEHAQWTEAEHHGSLAKSKAIPIIFKT